MSDRPTNLCDRTARELVALILDKQVSAHEVMTAHLDRIARVNPAVNAIVTLLPEAALDAADTADAALARGDDVGPLHGLPIAHKDLFVTAGIRTTFGSLAFTDHVPDETALIVEREQRGGRHHDRQDQHPRVRGRVPDLQRGVRGHPQPVRPDEDLWW